MNDSRRQSRNRGRNPPATGAAPGLSSAVQPSADHQDAGVHDLLEQALRGLWFARSWVRRRPMLSLGAAGFALAVVILGAGGRIGAGQSTRALTSWFGVQEARGVTSSDGRPAAVMLAAVAALVLLWVALVETVRRRGPSERSVWSVATAWALPFALGPPLTDTSVYSYVASGRVQRAGHDPYTAAASTLGSAHIVAAIDPAARGTPSSAGPLGSVLQHLAVSISGGTVLGAVVVWRVVGVLAAVAIGRLAAAIAAEHASGPDGGGGAQTRPAAVVLCAANPLVLLYVVSAPHLEALTLALVLAAVLLAGRGRWPAAVTAAGLAGSVTGQGFVAVPLVLAAHLTSAYRTAGSEGTARRRRVLGRTVGVDVLTAAATIGLLGLVQPDGFGWLRTIRRQFAQHTPFAPSDLVARALGPVVRGASFDDLAAGGRVTAAAAAVFVLGYLTATAGRRSLETGIGYGLLALALLAPVLHPWYLIWGALALAPTARGPRRVCVVALCAAACLLSPPGFGERTGNALTGAALGIVAVVAAVVLLSDERRRAAVRAALSEPTPRPAYRGPERS